MGKPGRISAGPVANYTSQEAAAPGRVSIHYPLRESLTQPGPTRGANPLAGHLGLEPETDSPPMMLQLQEQRQCIIVPRERSSVVLARVSRTTVLQLYKPALRL